MGTICFSSKISYLGEETEPHLLYPEPHEGWDEGENCNCSSTNHQSPIEIPSMKDQQVEKDDGTFAQIIDIVISQNNWKFKSKCTIW